jgi:transcriptional regulator of acetoin/glycerol metabolism
VPTLSSEHSPSSKGQDVPRAHLFVVLGCATPLAGSSRHLLDGVEEVLLGRGTASHARRTTESGRSTLRITLSDDRISTSHARLSRVDVQGEEIWTLEDLGSKNGTFVNGAIARQAPLADGDLLQIGHTLLLFRSSLPTPLRAAPDVHATIPASAFATLLPALANDFEGLAAIAPTEIPVLLLSETGTGKEIVARALHLLSRRAGAFVPVNCGTLTATLAESLLFGHRRGAFSGATGEHTGLVRAASEGTLLLDELGDMPLALQPMLLRAIQEGEVLPVGANAPVRIRTRFVGATHRDLEKRVSAGAFREDLLARLSGFVFRLPPLRERKEDLGLLVGALLHKIQESTGRSAALSVEAGTLLLRYPWPRNVRELEKCLARAVLFAEDGVIHPRHLPPELRVRPQPDPARGKAKDKEPAPRDEENRAKLVELLVLHRGNLRAVADALQTSRSQVHRWLRRFEIDVSAYRS